MIGAGERLGPYKIEAPLGAGGMGQVFRARDERLGREVAVKVLAGALDGDPERARRFEREARLAGGLSHPAILAVFDVGDHAGVPYLVTELLEGETLRERLRSGPLSVRKVIDVAVQIAQGLAAAHEAGVLHRDLKPENLFLCRDGRVKILDFGLAKETKAAQPPADLTGGPTLDALTGDGALMGTIGYMSPEQVRGQKADHRSDLFALGVVLYEMVAGKPPFDGASPIERSYAVLKDDPPALAGAPPGLEVVVRRCLEKSPLERYQSARDLAFHLQSLSGLSYATGPIAAAPPRRPPWALIGGLVALVAATAGVTALALGHRRTAQASAARPAPTKAPVFDQILFRDGTVNRARFAPDGKSVIASAIFPGETGGIYQVLPGQTQLPMIASEAQLLAVEKTGDLIIRAKIDGKQTVARVSPAGGAPRPLYDGTDVFDVIPAPDGRLAFLRRSSSAGVQLEFPEGNVLAQERQINSPRFSPKGDRVAYLSEPVGNDIRGTVVVLDLAGKKVAESKAHDGLGDLVWSPDGSEVWFGALDGHTNVLAALSVAGHERVIAGMPGFVQLFDVAPDGRVLLSERRVSRKVMASPRPGETADQELSWTNGMNFIDMTADGKTALLVDGYTFPDVYETFTRTLDGKPPVDVGPGRPLAISPDGKQIALSPKAPWDELDIVPTGVGERKVIKLGRIATLGIRAAFLDDGKRIVVAGNEKDRPNRLWMIDLESGAEPVPVTPEGTFFVAVSGDGKRALVNDKAGDNLLVNVEDPEAKPLKLTLPDKAQALRFSPDGRKIGVANNDSPDVSHIVWLDPATGKTEPWLDFHHERNPPIIGGGLAPDGTRVYGTSRDLDTLFVVTDLS